MTTTASLGRRAWNVVSMAWEQIFAQPVRSGRIRIRGWPRPLQVVIIVVSVLYAVTTIAVLASGLLRRVDSSVDFAGLSVWAWPVVTVDLWAAMVLLYLATLHLRLVIRVASWVVLATPHLTLVAGTYFATLDLQRLGLAGLVLLLGLLGLMVLGAVLLIVLAVLGPRRPTGPGTIVAVVVAFAATYLVPQVVVGTVSPLATAFPGIAMLLLLVVALPLAVAAGTAFAQVSINACTWVLLSLRREVTDVVWAPLVLVLGALAVIVNSVSVARHASVESALWTAVEAVVCLALATFGLRQAREVGPFDTPRPTALAEELGRLSMLFGVLLGCWMLPLMLDLVVPLPGLVKDHSAVGADFLLAAGAGIMAVRAARRGSPTLATLLPPIAVTAAYAGLRTLLDLPSLQTSVSNLVICAVLGIAMVIWRREGPLGVDRLFVLAVGFLMVLVFPWREQVAEPLAVLLGFSSVGVLFFGLLWRLLTDAEFTYRETPRFPGGARLLTFLAYATFAAAAMVVVAFRGPDSMLQVVDLDQLAGIGDAVIGFGLSMAVVVGLIELGRFGIDVEPEVEDDEAAVDSTV